MIDALIDAANWLDTTESGGWFFTGLVFGAGVLAYVNWKR